MDTATKTREKKATGSLQQMGDFFGKLYSFNTSLKLYHWHVTGKGSYAQHIALDQAIESLTDVLDRVVETSYSKYGEVNVTVPETDVPRDIVEHAEKFYAYVEDQRELFSEDFTDSRIDDYQEGIQQLLYRLKRLQ